MPSSSSASSRPQDSADSAQTAPAAARKQTAPGRSAGTDLGLIAVFAAFVAVCAVLPAIPVGPLAVPITLQTLAVYLTGLVLGGRRGFLAVALYVVVGLVGLPIFSGFRGGPAVLAGPSAGYIIAFPIAAACVGFLAYAVLRRGVSRGRVLLGLISAALLGGFLITRVFGIPGMMLNGGLTLRDAFLADLLYWPGDLLKLVLAAMIAAAVHRAFPRLAARS
ncbi:biotin transporter BioY [Kocuria palustris]|uniref:biotin transporter BioY n=1 Tax=Kocuria palustris TaxID=71999 RepID=UPI0006AA42B3|nr:biotin transporter BioY [Kocuria palustris]ALB03192.1 transcriptional regulator [Kocuria palustris]